MKVLMSPVSDRPECRSALKVTLGLADRLGANVVGCHLRPSRDKRKEYPARKLLLIGGSDQQSLDELAKKTTKTASARARESFEQLAREAGFTLARRPRINLEKGAIWQEKVGTPDRIMAIVGPLSDLIVVSRTASKGKVDRMFMLAALLHSGRPVLIMPPGKAAVPGKRIAIAWNQSPEAARVVSACMPLLQAADKVHIISAGRDNQLGPKSGQLAAYLAHYGIKAEKVRTQGHEESAELTASFREAGTDLILMGAYSRARFRELVFGGMTELMLKKSPIPVIMQHH
jgi:nucleotide-binding universal stress UspA family protein